MKTKRLLNIQDYYIVVDTITDFNIVRYGDNPSSHSDLNCNCIGYEYYYFQVNIHTLGCREISLTYNTTEEVEKDLKKLIQAIEGKDE